MATRKRQIKKSNRKTKSKYFMKGCAIKNKSLASKIKHRKTCPKCRTMRGGCGTCNMSGGNKRGGGSLGFFDHLSNIVSNSTTGITNFTTSLLYAAPPGVSAYPTAGQLTGKI
jgi:hypothetical protein